MTVKITKPPLNLREELASLRNQGGAYEESKLYLDNLVTNGDFSNGTTGWTGSYCNLSETNGTLLVTNTANNGWAYQTINTEVGKTYSVSVNVIAESANNFWFVVSSDLHPDTNQLLNKVIPTTGVQTATFVATGSESTVILRVNGASGSYIEFDNVSVQEVGENLVTNGTFDTDSGWTLGTNASISGGTLSYSGASGNVITYQDIGLEQNKTYHITATVSGYVQGHVSFRAGSNNTDTPDITANGTYSFVFTVPSNGNNNFIIDASTTFVGSIDNIIVTEGSHPVIQSIPYGYEVKDVYIDGELAREGEAYDYEVKTDGINQWLKPSVEPTATTETVVIGVRK